MGRIAVTGLGVVSTLASSFDLAEGSPAGGEARLCEIPLDVIPAEKRARIGRLDRLCRLFLSASSLAAAEARLDVARENAEELGLSFGSGLGCLLTDAEFWEKIVEQGTGAASPRLFAYTVSSAAAGEVSIALGIKGPNVTQHCGLAAGLAALAYGFDLVDMGKASAVLAGGADANGAVIAEALRDMGLLKGAEQARPFVDSVPGVSPSEGAVVAVLESEERARRRGAQPWGFIAGYAAGFEPTLASGAPAWTGVSETMRRALAQSGVDAGDVDLVITSAHGTPVDAAERRAVVEALGNRPLLLAPKALFGEAFAASALLGWALTLGAGDWGLGAGSDPPDASDSTCSTSPQPPTPSPILFRTDGSHIEASETARRLRAASVVLVQSLCYSGNVVSLIFTRRE